MTEVEWLACAELVPMIRVLSDRKVRERKIRLFAVACCLRIWEMIPDEECRRGVILAESFADGRVDLATMKSAIATSELASRRWLDQGCGTSEAVQAVISSIRMGFEFPTSVAMNSRFLAKESSDGPEFLDLSNVTHLPVDAVARKANHDAYLAHWGDREARLRWLARDTQMINPDRDARLAEELAQAYLLREIFGNPFRRLTIDSAWLARNDATVPKLAEAIYEDKDFDRLPILADALEEAGCVDFDILDHCWRGGVHVRGCWVLDSLLGRR